MRRQTRGLGSSSRLANESNTCSGVCFICNQPAEASNVLYKVLTIQFHQSVCKLAEDLSDANLLGKLGAGDFVAQGAMVHKACYRTYNKHNKQNTILYTPFRAKSC